MRMSHATRQETKIQPFLYENPKEVQTFTKYQRRYYKAIVYTVLLKIPLYYFLFLLD